MGVKLPDGGDGPARLPVGAHAVGLLLGGTSATLLSKSLLSSRVIGPDGRVEVFAKPAFITFMVYLSYMLNLPTGLRHGLTLEHITYEACTRCLVLSFLGIASVAFLQTGLIFVPASSSLMLRMSSIAFTAGIRRVCFGRRLESRQVIGIWLLVFALTIVTGSVFRRAAGPQALLGCGLTVLAQVIRGVILVSEEHVMKRLPPFAVLIGEGFFGIIAMLTIVFPILSALPGPDDGSLESFPGTLSMLRHHDTLDALVCAYLASVTWESASGIMVTALLSSVHRSFLQFGVRIMTVWLASLTLFWLSDGEYGEPWDTSSYVQLVGFAVLLVSAKLYFGGAAPVTSSPLPVEPLLKADKA